MKSMRITILLLMLSMGFASLAIAQEESVPEGATSPSSGRTCPLNVEFSGKLKSRHVWNGCLSTTAWNLQPDLTISAYGLFVNAWGLIPISKDFSTEIDFTLGYSIGPVTLMYTDFFYLSQDKYENCVKRMIIGRRGLSCAILSSTMRTGSRSHSILCTSGSPTRTPSARGRPLRTPSVARPTRGSLPPSRT